MATKPTTAASKVEAKRELSTNNYLAGVLAISLLVLLVSGFVLKSIVGSIIVNTKVISGKAQASSDLDVKLKNIPILLDNYELLGKKKTVIENGLPNTPDLPQIITIMQYISGKSDVVIKEIKPSNVQSEDISAGDGTGKEPVGYDFQVMVDGQYPQMVTFFKNLELSARPMKVKSVSFKGDTGSLTAEVSIQTYYQGKADIKDKTEQVK